MIDEEIIALCILNRASDLAHLMLNVGLPVVMANGRTANGHPCTVVYAIGPTSDVLKDIGSALCRRVESEQDQARRN